MKVGGQIPWNVAPTCETSQISFLMGRRPMKDVFGQPFKVPIIPFVSLVEYHTITAKDQSRIHQFGKKVLPGLFLGYALYVLEWAHNSFRIDDRVSSRLHHFGKKVLPGVIFGFALYAVRIWKADILVAEDEELEKMDASETYAWRLNATEVLPPKNGVFHFPKDFKHGLVDESVPEHRDSSSSSHELPLEPRAKVVPSKHNIFLISRKTGIAISVWGRQ